MSDSNSSIRVRYNDPNATVATVEFEGGSESGDPDVFLTDDDDELA